QCPVGEFRCDQFCVLSGFTINGSISPRESDQATLERFITEGFCLRHVKRMPECPTRRPGDHQRVNGENKNDADEDDALKGRLSIARCVETPNETEISHWRGR